MAFNDNLKNITPNLSEIKTGTPILKIGDKYVVGGIGGNFIPGGIIPENNNSGNENPNQGGIDTSDATATSADILEGKTAYVNEQKLSGSAESMNINHLNIVEDGILQVSGPIHNSDTTYFSISNIMGSGDLAAENIAYGKTICGIRGTYGGSIPGNVYNYVIPDNFIENIKVAFWKNYTPIRTINMYYNGNSTGPGRYWTSADNKPYWLLYYLDGAGWYLDYNDEYSVAYPCVMNSLLQKHGWTLTNSTWHTPDNNEEFDFISIEDFNWIPRSSCG